MDFIFVSLQALEKRDKNNSKFIEKSLSESVIKHLQSSLKYTKKRLLKEMNIISMFIILEEGLDIKVISNKTS